MRMDRQAPAVQRWVAVQGDTCLPMPKRTVLHAALDVPNLLPCFPAADTRAGNYRSAATDSEQVPLMSDDRSVLIEKDCRMDPDVPTSGPSHG